VSHPSTTVTDMTPVPPVFALEKGSPALVFEVVHTFCVARADLAHVHDEQCSLAARLLGQRWVVPVPHAIRDPRPPVGEDGWPIDLHEYELTPTTTRKAA
jgi:hypothetical protein